MKKLLFLLGMLVTLSSCKKITTIYIASKMVDCRGVGLQKCLLVRENLDKEWTNFYDTIEGFDYEEGYTYSLQVAISNIENPPADGSKLKYSLLKIISKKKEVNKSQNKKTQNDQTIVAYEALSRGSFIKTMISKKGIELFKDRNLKNKIIKTCTEKQWDKVVSSLKEVDIKNINKLRAPSNKRLYDGAAHAQLKITLDDKTYTSSGFDHGNPPEEIKALVLTILSLTESVE